MLLHSVPLNAEPECLLRQVSVWNPLRRLYVRGSGVFVLWRQVDATAPSLSHDGHQLSADSTGPSLMSDVVELDRPLAHHAARTLAINGSLPADARSGLHTKLYSLGPGI